MEKEMEVIDGALIDRFTEYVEAMDCFDMVLLNESELVSDFTRDMTEFFSKYVALGTKHECSWDIFLQLSAELNETGDFDYYMSERERLFPEGSAVRTIELAYDILIANVTLKGLSVSAALLEALLVMTEHNLYAVGMKVEKRSDTYSSFLNTLFK